jgi:hypothetical protein
MRWEYSISQTYLDAHQGVGAMGVLDSVVLIKI